MEKTTNFGKEFENVLFDNLSDLTFIYFHRVLTKKTVRFQTIAVIRSLVF